MTRGEDAERLVQERLREALPPEYRCSRAMRAGGSQPWPTGGREAADERA
ncbi:MAG: hypothetical protein ABIG85_01250 [Chloroflexota bacterium]